MTRQKTDHSLPPRRAAFVREYCIDRNATQAAIRAGYSRPTAYAQASRLFRNVQVRAAIDQQLAVLAEKTDTSAQWVRERLRAEADDRSERSSHSARVRAIELIGRLNGDFEKDNKQRAGVFEDVPTDVLTEIEQKLRAISGRSDGSGRSGSGNGGGFTH